MEKKDLIKILGEEYLNKYWGNRGNIAFCFIKLKSNSRYQLHSYTFSTKI